MADQKGVTQQGLVQRAGYDANTTGSMLKLIERQGLIIREPHPTDGRAKFVRLTEKGRKQQRELWKASHTLRQRLWKCVRPQDREIVAETLLRVEEEMERFRAELEESRKP